MIRTADRMGHITEEDSFQNNLLEKIYGSVAGRMLIGRWSLLLFPLPWDGFWIPGFRQQR